MFETGISRYITGKAEVENHFPVDNKGNPHLACVHCDYYHRNSMRCGLNGSRCDFPEKYLGGSCPLYFEGEN